jgi:mRNA interferase RelE/StbE
MPGYRVELSKQAAKELRKLDHSIQARILAALRLLQDQPKPHSATALVGNPNYLRVRVGDYRVVYRVEEGQLLVLVITLGHRKKVYKALNP